MNQIFEKIKTELDQYIQLYYQEDLHEPAAHIPPVVVIDT